MFALRTRCEQDTRHAGMLPHHNGRTMRGNIRHCLTDRNRENRLYRLKRPVEVAKSEKARSGARSCSKVVGTHRDAPRVISQRFAMTSNAIDLGPQPLHKRSIRLAQSSARQRTQLQDLAILAVFTLSIFTSASLLFAIQPMVGKILLPKLGGAPAVWNTCMMFFQLTLLLGYLSAHLLTKFVSLRGQVLIFSGALLLALQTLPLAVGPEWVDALLQGTNPNLWLLSVLFCRVAPAFFVLSITSPLLQKWFARSGHPQGSDPYFLYAASNIGSIVSLLAYPFLIEVLFGVGVQTEYWKFGFAAFTLLAAICGIASWCGSGRATHASPPVTQKDEAEIRLARQAAPTWKRRAYWVLLAAIPSSLMLGITTYVSTDLSSIPLIWVLPLTLYLLTFVIAFASRQMVSAYWMGRIASLLILAIMVTLVAGTNDLPVVIIPLHLLMFFTVTMLCHQRLAGDRPDAEHLTDFYLCMSLGGVLGGMFNALIAPSLFSTILEYPLMMIAASLMRETRAGDSKDSSETPVRLVTFGLVVFLSILILRDVIHSAIPAGLISLLASVTPLSAGQWKTLLVFGIPACLVFYQMEHRKRFSAGLAAIFLVNVCAGSLDASVLQRDRNFYGTITTVRHELAGREIIKMYHGNTVHGCQWVDEDQRRIPLTYYGKSSGIGRLIRDRQSTAQPIHIGAIGLGTGTLSATLRPQDSIVYYEINEQVVEHAEQHFTYLKDARERGTTISTRLGDARLVLEVEARNHQAGSFDILVVDAFSSDSIPVHLLTDECLKIYQQHLRPGGVLAFHITNRYLNLEPVLAVLANQNALQAYRYTHRHLTAGPFDEKTGEATSSWVLLAQGETDIAHLEGSSPAKPLSPDPRQRPWSDDYSNVLGVFRVRF